MEENVYEPMAVCLHLATGGNVVGGLVSTENEHYKLYRPMNYYAINPALSQFEDTTYLSFVKYNSIGENEMIDFRKDSVVSIVNLTPESSKWYYLNAKFAYDVIAGERKEQFDKMVETTQNLINTYIEYKNKPKEEGVDDADWAKHANTDVAN